MLTGIPDTRPDRRPAKPQAAPSLRDQPARPAKYPATGADTRDGARDPLPSGAARTMSAMFARTRQDILQPIRLKAQLGALPTCRRECVDGSHRYCWISRSGNTLPNLTISALILSLAWLSSGFGRLILVTIRS